MDYENPWTYQDRAVTDETVEGFVAFVYIITNQVTKKKYIGKKRLQFTKTKQVKKKKKRIKVPSDWKTYYGSNKELQSDIEKYGEEKCKREIIALCKTLGESSYWEAHYQFVYEVLLHPDEFYNDWIMVKVRRSHLPKN
jgi:hypothetical protein